MSPELPGSGWQIVLSLVHPNQGDGPRRPGGCDKDTALALLLQLTSRRKLITNVYYDNYRPRADVKGLCSG